MNKKFAKLQHSHTFPIHLIFRRGHLELPGNINPVVSALLFPCLSIDQPPTPIACILNPDRAVKGDGIS